MKHLCAVFLIFVSSSVLFAADKPEEIFAEGQDHFYNAEYQEAIASFDRYITQRPDDYRGYWRKAYAMYFEWKREQKEAMFPRVSEGQKEDFFHLVELGIKRADAAIAAKKNVDFALYVKACLISMRGGIEFKNVSLFAAKNSLKESLAVAAQSHYQDAKYLAGLAGYDGSKSFWRRRGFSLAGLPHDREEGLEKVFEAFAANNGPFKDDVAFIIFRIETDPKNEGRFAPEEIERIACDLWSRYKRNEVLQEYCLQQACGPGGR